MKVKILVVVLLLISSLSSYLNFYLTAQRSSLEKQIDRLKSDEFSLTSAFRLARDVSRSPIEVARLCKNLDEEACRDKLALSEALRLKSYTFTTARHLLQYIAEEEGIGSLKDCTKFSDIHQYYYEDTDCLFQLFKSVLGSFSFREDEGMDLDKALLELDHHLKGYYYELNQTNADTNIYTHTKFVTHNILEKKIKEKGASLDALKSKIKVIQQIITVIPLLSAVLVAVADSLSSFRLLRYFLRTKKRIFTISKSLKMKIIR